ncbi:hypothetical protein BVY02_01755, partial [bacterium J17]
VVVRRVFKISIVVVFLSSLLLMIFALPLAEWWVAQKIKKELNEFLGDAIQATADVGSIDVSFLNLNLTVDQVSLRSRDGESAAPARSQNLALDRVSVDVDLGGLFDGILRISKVHVVGLRVPGFGESSEFSRLVDYLTRPKTDSQNFIDVIVDKVVLYNSSFLQNIGNKMLRGEGLQMELDLAPSVAVAKVKLASLDIYEGGRLAKRVSEDVAGEFVVKNGEFILSPFRFNLLGETVSVERALRVSDTGLLSGTLRGPVDIRQLSALTGVTLDARGVLNTEVIVSGSLDTPTLTLAVEQSAAMPLAYGQAANEMKASEFAASANMVFAKDHFVANVSSLNLAAARGSLSLIEPLKIVGSKVNGKFQAKFTDMAFEDSYRLKDGIVTATVGGVVANPEVKFESSVGVSGLINAKVSAEGQLNNGRITFFVSDSSKLLRLKGEGSVYETAPKVNFDWRVDLKRAQLLLPTISRIAGDFSGNGYLQKIQSGFSLNGEYRLTEGVLFLEGKHVELNRINSSGTFTQSGFQVVSGAGEFNGGSLNFSGNYDFDFDNLAELQILFSKVSFNTDSDISFVSSGALRFQSGSAQKRPLLQGSITIDRALVEHRLKIAELVSVIPELFTRSSKAEVDLEDVKDVELDLEVSSAGDLDFKSNIALAEFRGKIKVKGTLVDPKISGKLEVVEGTFRIGENEFEIVTGAVRINPGDRMPFIEALAECSVVMPQGDDTIISVEIFGPVDQPQVTFVSDKNLSQEEILRLLTMSDGSGVTAATQFAYQELGSDVLQVLGEDTPLDFNKIIRQATTIDEVKIEPTFSSDSNELEFQILATKYLGELFSVSSESTVGGRYTQQQMRLRYDVLPILFLDGVVQVPISDRETGVGGDLTYEIYPEDERRVSYLLDSDVSLDFFKLKDYLDLKRNSKVHIRSLRKIEERTLTWLKARGFWQASVKVSCSDEVSSFCRRVEFEVLGSEPSKIKSIVVESETSFDQLEDRLEKEFEGKELMANDESREHFEGIAREALSETYISARVSSRYIDVPELAMSGRDKQLVVEVWLEPLARVELKGNVLLSDEELLSEFGSGLPKNQILASQLSALRQQIITLYRKEGYYWVSVSLEREDDSATKEISYQVEISEGSVVVPAEVELQGNSTLPREEIERLLAKYYPEQSKRVLRPDRILPEELDKHARLLEELYNREGYQNCSVKWRVDKDTTRKGADGELLVTLVFAVEEGSLRTVRNVDFNGWPRDVPSAKVVEVPFPFASLQSYVDGLEIALRHAGYFAAEVSSSYSQNSGSATIDVDAGERAKIAEIQVKGAHKVGSEFVMRKSGIVVGDYWSLENFRESRKKLLRTGLFTSVEFLAADGKLDRVDEQLVVRVQERRLKNLSVGGGYDSEFGYHLFGKGKDRSLFRDGKYLAANIDGYYSPDENSISKGSAGLRFVAPYLFGGEHSLSEEIRFERVDTKSSEFDLDRGVVASYLSRHFGLGNYYTFGHSFSIEDVSDIDDDAILSPLDEGRLNVSYLSGNLSIDRRDSLIFPRDGYKLDFDTRYASSALGSEADFIETGAGASYYFPFSVSSSRFGLAFHLGARANWPLFDTDYVPISYRLFLGGRSSLRGFDENSLGPKGDEGSVVGGDLSLLNNTELRYFYGERLSAHVFSDLGNVYLREESIDGLRQSVGFGARYISPVGAMTLEMGFPIDRDEDESSSKVHFSIGASF